MRRPGVAITLACNAMKPVKDALALPGAATTAR
jgi:hypothetical protein